ncbi:heme-binding protein [Intrasporangium calvum]|uniref:Heme-binding protein n=1 Tax=Intrasporangium calvum TaxID=53358 RepID=A0ABT5GLV5_9MICO|nr:heme-binding protein [Intrasporangium calvum]MDC5699026.1 heme-binding protein [Intrasporangium calvum]
MTTTAARATFVRTTQTMTYAAGRAAVDAALERAAELGVPVNVAVTDPSGALLAFARMDGAPLLSSGIAQDKAWTVSAFNGIATHEFFDLIKDEPALREGIVHRERLVVFGGGVPVRVDGVLVGAVGVSGGSAEQDREIAEAGAAAVTHPA